MVDFSAASFWIALFSFAFAPTYWNTVARLQYKTQIVSKIFCGSKYLGCYVLALSIFLLQLQRDFAFNIAINDQPYFAEASEPINQMFCYFLFFCGSVLVLSSFWVLGITGTYLGDYFGILMDEMVTGFPFNLVSNPMYTGSVMNLLAAALWKGSPAGVLLTIWSQIVYYVAVRYFEGPFTSYIYAQREKEENEKGTKTTGGSKKRNKKKKKNQ